MITDFRDKKLTEHLRPNERVLIRFGHGLGDMMMFMPHLEALRNLYPETQIDLYVEAGQEEVVQCISDKDATGYDHVFSLDFPMAEGTGKTKGELCCDRELGISPSPHDVMPLPHFPSPLVAVHFQGTALPELVNCPPAIAREIWSEILAAGLIPIECHFEHVFHNPKNIRYEWIDRHVRGCAARVTTLIGLLQHCRAFVGVASGPFVVALSVMPWRMMFLKNQHHLEDYTRAKLPSLDVMNYQAGTVRAWLEKMG